MVKMSTEVVVAATNDGYAIVNAMQGVAEGGPWKAFCALAAVVMMFAVIGLWAWKFISRVCSCRGRHLIEEERAAAAVMATAVADKISWDWATTGDGNGSDGGGSDVGEEKVMKIWLSPAGDSFTGAATAEGSLVSFMRAGR